MTSIIVILLVTNQIIDEISSDVNC